MNAPRSAHDLEPRSTDGLSDVDAARIDEVMRGFLQHLVRTDPEQRPRHYALFVLTLERSDDDNDIVTTDTVTTMARPDMHTLLRDWLHKETH